MFTFQNDLMSRPAMHMLDMFVLLGGLATKIGEPHRHYDVQPARRLDVNRTAAENQCISRVPVRAHAHSRPLRARRKDPVALNQCCRERKRRGAAARVLAMDNLKRRVFLIKDTRSHAFWRMHVHSRPAPCERGRAKHKTQQRPNKHTHSCE